MAKGDLFDSDSTDVCVLQAPNGVLVEHASMWDVFQRS